MDNLGDWLYIVLLVAAGISGLISSGKKKKQAGQPPQEPTYIPENDEQSTETKGFWEIFEEIKNESTQPKQNPPVPQNVVKENRKKTQKKPTETSSYSQREKRRTAAKSTLGESFNKETPENDAFSLTNESFHDTEELRKAIIYSEILNRKY